MPLYDSLADGQSNTRSGVFYAVQPFETIESAHEFMLVLENVIADTQSELEALLNDTNSASDERRREALPATVWSDA